MCNPPFFATLEETGKNRKRVCKATPNELTCPGGLISRDNEAEKIDFFALVDCVLMHFGQPQILNQSF